MGRVRLVTAMVLLAVWIPATWQCRLEQAGIFEAEDCCPASLPQDQSAEKGGTVCCVLASGHFKVDDGPKYDVAPEEQVLCVGRVNDRAPVDSVGMLGRGFGIPWQIEQRAALPVRAPSLAS